MHKLNIRQTLAAPLDRVYAAWTDVHQIKQWFAPGEMKVPEASAELRVGGAYRIVMQSADGEKTVVAGKYLEIEPQAKLTFTWQWEGSEVTTKVSVIFSAIDEKTAQIELTHTEFQDVESCAKHQQGWQGCIANLAKFL